MGAYVSIPECKSHYNITVNCDYFVNESYPVPTIGGFGRREIPTDPDVAGVGVCCLSLAYRASLTLQQVISSFLATTSLALLLSIASVLWLMIKRRSFQKNPDKHKKKGRNCNLSFSELCETLVLGCSDTQIFTGGAYAITLRYFKGCSIIAYHYNIICGCMFLSLSQAT
jgi:hypothetical protein